MADAAAIATGVVKRFAPDAPPALDGVGIEILPGKMTGLVGPDGAGKTTLIRIIAGLIEPDAGEVIVGGRPALDADRSQLGYMPQRFGLYEDLTVRENLDLYAELRGLSHDEREERFGKLLDFTDLKRFQQRLAGKLSGGMKQKLGLACALVRAPKLLLLDEPGVGVDPVSRRELWAMVRDLAGEGIGVLWSTAYLDEAEQCDTVFLLSEGRLLHSGPPRDLTATMQGRIVRLDVPEKARRATLRQALDHPAIEDGTVQGDSIRLMLRPDTKAPEAQAIGGEPGRKLRKAEPRFEDAFIDLLGGGPKGTSELAEHYPLIPETGEAAIEARGLTKRFGDFTAARDVSFRVGRGQVFGLLGPNGAGKSTTFKMLCGLLTPSEGTGSVAGNDLRTASADARQSLGYMAQKFSLYGDLSVRQNLDFFAGAYGLSGSDAKQAIERAIEIFHLERYLKDNSGGLPLGYKQRLALACAVLHEPPVLFLDEPTSGVDPIVRREFWTHINGLVEKGVTVLVTTHFMEEAEYCDRIALIYRAEQIATGTPDELKAQVGRPDATMEDAFIALIEASDRAREAEAA
ncbi:ATP-binding cassette domain-containing protein [Sphingomonas sp. AOB5]|uniref:ATP-binding cassette domain-containing protein n=1 Tax=Sphingomonas sp. AOB5 TaxID=3034017 RepID=UPI0023F9DC0B|nr:ATP-binding cassette domain-containing protein [Sphingomonas sp. AOB5]MDF7777205.1 ATP-binding cassette domain-containing protein [Sphingomonas sp. AOB5]